MSELKLYREHKAGWILYLMYKHLRGPRFDAVKRAMKRAVNEEELNAAHQAWRDQP